MARKYPVLTSAIPKGKARPVRKDARGHPLRRRTISSAARCRLARPLERFVGRLRDFSESFYRCLSAVPFG
jgi:hypothetical protein